MLLLPNASFCITCGKLQNKHLEALGNSTDFMLLALADRHLPQPACCGNYNLLPLHYLFPYLYRLYMPLPVPCSISDFCVSFQIPQPKFFWFSRIPGASTFILQRQEAYLEPWWPALFRIGRKFLNGQKILKKQQSWKKQIVGGNHPRKMPPSFSVTNPSDFRSGTFSHPKSHISGPKNAYLSNKLGNLNLGKSGWRMVSKHYPISFPMQFPGSPYLRPAIPMSMAFIVSRSMRNMLCFEERYAAEKKNARKRKRSKIDVYHPGKDFSHGTKTSFVVFKTYSDAKTLWYFQSFE